MPRRGSRSTWYDLGGKRWSHSPRELLMFRLEGGSYRQAPIADEYRSDVLGTRVRIMPDAREREEELRGVPEEDRSPPRFQWWDPDTERWRDRETDAEVERETERERHAGELQETRTESLQAGRDQERWDVALILLHDLLSDALTPADLELVEEHWHRNGPPTDVVASILAVHRTPAEWRILLLDDAVSDNHDTQASNRPSPGTL